MIVIYTHSWSPFTKEFWKWVARRMIGKYSGPNAVEDSVLRGLKKLSVPFRRNTKLLPGDVAVVLSGIEALREAIAMKQNGRIEKIIAGPNILAHPHDANRIMCSEHIDIIPVPSQWVADMWAHEAPELASKLRVWPAGVALATASTHTGAPIIYDKIGEPSLLAEVQSILPTGTHLFTYGSFSQKEYLKALRTAPYLIYLARSESQGLALQEAWAHDVPTLVNKSDHWESSTMSWDTPNINAPYLTPALGYVFDDIDEFPQLIRQAIMLHPKQYCDTHLSDEASVRILLNLL